MKQSPRRGQVALEYLTTYGFALLVMLITIGAINYLGFFNADILRSNVCNFPTGLQCEDYQIIDDVDGAPGNQPGVRFILSNEYGVNLTVVDQANSGVNMSLQPSSTDVAVFCDDPFPSHQWQIGTNLTFTCRITPDTDFVSNQRYDAVIAIGFNQSGGSYTHVVSGLISTRSE